MTTLTCYKYIRSWSTEDARCEDDKRTKTVIAKAAFWQNKKLMRRNVKFNKRLKMRNCYVFSILNMDARVGREKMAVRIKVNAFKM